jgi:hypothetical protein
MKSSKWVAAIPPYLAVWAGLFLFHSAWGAMLGFHAAILLVLLIARPKIPIHILFKAKNFKWILPLAALCAASGFAIYHLFPLFSTVEELRSQLDTIGLNGSNWPWFIAYFSLVNPFVEEYFWRAYLGSETKRFYIGDLLYAGFHGLVLTGKTHPLVVLFALGCLTFVGWLWRQVYRENEGLLVPVLGHMVADFSVMMAVYLIVR